MTTTKYYFICILITLFIPLNSQNVSINIDGDLPNNSAILDIKSINNGLLIPRMTQSERDAINFPETGLLIFQTDAISGFYYFETIWKHVGSNYVESQNLNQTLNLGNNAGNKKITNISKVGIGTNSPDTSASLEIISTSSGVLIPRMSISQRNEIANPVVGLVIYCLTDNCIHFHNGTNWIEKCGSNSEPLGSSTNPGKTCKHILQNGASVGNGIYWIDPDSIQSNIPFECYCDMTTDGGGWTLVAQHTTGENRMSDNNFDTWATPWTIATGNQILRSGTMTPQGGELWIGLTQWTKIGNQMMSQMKNINSGVLHSVKYNSFTLNPNNQFSYNATGFSRISGDLLDDFGPFNGTKFSTLDQDNDNFANNCAAQFNGMGWHTACFCYKLFGYSTASTTNNYATGGPISCNLTGYYVNIINPWWASIWLR
jgi:hypothetical protein